jgi:CubicO group peptidase (beta-lactamase class C family)
MRRLAVAAVVLLTLVLAEERSRTFSFPTESRPAVAIDDDAAIAAATREILARAHAAASFSGCALVAVRGRVVVETCTPSLDPSTRFSIGSLEKQFTGLRVQELARDGKLALDDRADKH